MLIASSCNNSQQKYVRCEPSAHHQTNRTQLLIFPPTVSTRYGGCRLVEETDDLAGDVLSPGLLVVHDTSGGGEDNVTELTRRQELDDPLLEVTELDDDLAVTVVVDLLELADVAVLLHDLQELDDDLGARADEHLALAGLLGVVHRLQGIVEDGGLDHLGGVVWVDEILKARGVRLEVSLINGELVGVNYHDSRGPH